MLKSIKIFPKLTENTLELAIYLCLYFNKKVRLKPHFQYVISLICGPRQVR